MKPAAPERSFCGWKTDAAALAVLSLVFCLHYFHGEFIFQGDVFLNLYMHGNPALFEGGWDPHVLGYLGWYPIYGSLFPLNLPMHLLQYFLDTPLSALLLLQANAAISLFLLAFFIYLLFRFLGRSRIASLAGAVVVAFTGFHAQSSVRELDLFYLHSFMMVPPALIFLIKANEAQALRNTLLAGLMIGLSLLGGTNVPMFFFMPLFPFVILITKRPSEIRVKDVARGAATALGAAVTGMAVGAAMVLPSLKYMKYSIRQRVIQNDFFDPYALTLTLKSMLYRDIFTVFNHEYDPFLGLPVILLAAFGVLFCLYGRKGSVESNATRGWVFFAVAAVYSLFMMQAAYMPDAVKGILEFFFSLLSIRYPYRHTMMLLVAAGFFVAAGLDSYAVASKRARNIFLVAAIVLTAVYTATGLLYATYRPSYYSIILAAPVFILLLFLFNISVARPTLNAACKAAFPLLLFALFFLSRPDEVPFPDRMSYTSLHPNTVNGAIHTLYGRFDETFAPVLKGQPPFRIYNQGPILRTNIWAPGYGGYIAFEPMDDPAEPLFLREYMEIIDSYDSPIFDLYNVRYMAVTNSIINNGRAELSTQIEFVNPDAFERFFIAHGERHFQTESGLKDGLRAATREELRNNVYFLSGKDLRQDAPGPAGGDSVEVIKREARRITVDAGLGRPGYLCASELWFPAWEVFVGGKKTELLKSYGLFWAVKLDGGSHRVEFVFKDRYSFWGKVVSVSGMAAIVTIAVITRKKRRSSG